MTRSDRAAGGHPRVDDPLFVARLGYRQQRLVEVLAKGGARMTASPLYYVSFQPQLALVPGAVHGLGLALDPCLLLRQLPFADRAPAFRALPYGASPDAFDPDRDPVSPAELAALAVAPIELQRERGATLLLGGGHLVGAVGTRGRELELAIARAGIAHFRTQRLDEPPETAANPMTREIYATITVDVRLLRSAAVRADLCAAYAGLAADGLWVRMAGFDERAARVDIRCGGAFLAELRDCGRPVLCDQPGQLHLGLLADGLSAAVGLAEGERFRAPTPWPAAAAQEPRPGRRRSAYHPKLLRSYRLGGEAAARAFAEAPCTCRRHPGHLPPGGAEVAEHAAIVRCRQAADALDGDPEDRREWLLAAAAMAASFAREAGVDCIAPVVFEELFAGLDRRDERRREAS